MDIKANIEDILDILNSGKLNNGDRISIKVELPPVEDEPEAPSKEG